MWVQANGCEVFGPHIGKGVQVWKAKEEDWWEGMMSDPWKNTALRAACDHRENEPVNAGHRYQVRTLDTSYYADDVRLEPMTGYPEWVFRDPEYTLVCKRIENAVIYDYEGEWK